ncbi:MAG: hypothetical protein D6722_02785 [Bacteroidetes bacterium]|nr:MAG: hypothetical protein D6722_02785 [Bacteroidota bacterium]
MAEIVLPEEMTQAFTNLIPDQRARINLLMQEGTIRSYSLALDRRMLWVVLIAATEWEVEGILESFPIMPHCEAHIHELMFHDMVTHELPRISLN